MLLVCYQKVNLNLYGYVKINGAEDLNNNAVTRHVMTCTYDYNSYFWCEIERLKYHF